MKGIEKPTEVRAMEARISAPVKEKKTIQGLSEEFFTVFRGLYSKFFLNSALYYGRNPVKNLFESNSKVISAPCMAPLNELKSFVQNNTRIPTLFSYNKNIEQKYIDIINEAMINSYSANNVNKNLIDAWMDFMINGVGILKINGDFENLIHTEVVSPSSVVFDFTDLDRPQFFACEKIMSTEEASNEYDIDQKEFEPVFGHASTPKILISMESWDDNINKWFSEEAEGKELKKKNMQDIFSDSFTSKIVYEKPNISLNVIREEYKRANVNDKGKIIEMYERKVFLNDILVSVNHLRSENFPFIIMHNIKKDTMNLKDAFPCFLDQVRADILLFNNLYCLQLDGLTSSAAGSSLVIADTDAMEDGANRTNKSASKLNIVKLKTSADKGINDLITKTSPIDLSQSIQNEMQLCLTRMRSCTGLMNFETPMKSGYQESLRLDREMSNISYWITNIDDAIIKVGKLMKNTIKKLLTEEVSTLQKFICYPEVLDAETCKILKNVIEESVNGVKENKDAFTFKSKIINDLITLRDLTGESINIDVKVLASNLRMPQEVIDTISNNTPDPEVAEIEKEALVSEIEKTKTDSVKNIAMSNKYNAEAKTELKEAKRPIKKESKK